MSLARVCAAALRAFELELLSSCTISGTAPAPVDRVKDQYVRCAGDAGLDSIQSSRAGTQALHHKKACANAK